MRTHGMRKTIFYQKYHKMVTRCTKETDKRYKDYGGRGIECEWKSFEDFRDDMYESYLQYVEEFGRKETTIDRINVNGNYCKENCRWATWAEQSRNRRDRKPINFNGKSQLITDWSKELKLPLHVLWLRIYRYGWEVEKAFTAPIGPTSKRYS